MHVQNSIFSILNIASSGFFCLFVFKWKQINNKEGKKNKNKEQHSFCHNQMELSYYSLEFL